MIVSLHDVMPQTMSEVLELVDWFQRHDVHPVTLLVVAGQEWNPRDIETLKRLQDKGYPLAGHGWTHACAGWRSWRHRVHGLVISRDQAEHLALAAQQIRETIQRSYDWFVRAGLEPPELYVPPAWALGEIDRGELRQLPYAAYETLTGIYRVRSGRFRRLPLVGYEADTRLRVATLKTLNALNRCLARSLARPLRVAIHPHDLQLGLARDLQRLLSRAGSFLSYPDD